MRAYTINIDYDGTCVAHDFPRISKDIGAIDVLLKLTNAGHKLILFTMRSDKADVATVEPGIHNESANYLTQAVNWFYDNNIPLYMGYRSIQHRNHGRLVQSLMLRR